MTTQFPFIEIGRLYSSSDFCLFGDRLEALHIFTNKSSTTACVRRLMCHFQALT